MASYPSSTPSDSTLWQAVNSVQTTLSGALLSTGDNTSGSGVAVADASFLPTAGFITVGTEIIKYTGKTGNNLTGITRGADGTSGAAHDDGTVVAHFIVAAHHNDLKDEIIAVATDLRNTLVAQSQANIAAMAADVAASISNRTPNNLKKYGAVGNGSTDDLAALNSALSAIGSNVAELFIPSGTYVLSNNVTIPSNVTLVFQTGAMLSPASGKTVTINGPVKAEIRQIFTGAGLIRGTLQTATVYPEWWGAVGNGSTDDATAIKAAMVFVHNTGIGGTVIFSQKTYIVGSYITVYADTTLLGLSWKAVLKLKDSASCPVLYASSASNIVIRNLTLDGNRANNPVSTGAWPLTYSATIIFPKCKNTRIENNQILNSYYGMGIYGLGADNAVIHANYFYNCEQGIDNYGFGQVISDNNFEAGTGGAISIEPTTEAGTNINEANGLDSTWLVSDYSQALEVSIHGNTIRGGRYGIILFDGTVGVTITDNHIANVSGVGIDAPHSNIKGLVITGNTIRNVTGTNVDGNPWNMNGAGIVLASILGGTVTDNTIEYCWVGIYGTTQRRTIIANNVVQFCATSGICLYSSSGVTLANNLMYNNFLNRSTYVNNAGIMLYACSNCVLIGNNTIDTNGYAIGCIYCFSTNTGHYLGANFANGTTSGVTINFATSAVSDRLTYSYHSPMNFIKGFKLVNQTMSTSSAIPNTGTWSTGDFVFNISPSELGTAGSKYVILGWTCISGGTSGTWRDCRVLTGN